MANTKCHNIKQLLKKKKDDRHKKFPDQIRSFWITESTMIQIIAIIQQSIISIKISLTIQLLCLQEKSNHVS